MTQYLHTSVAFHAWRQPDNLDFNTSDGFTGALGHVELKLIALRFGTAERPKHLAVNAGVTAKTRGFVPEESYLERKVGVLLGIDVSY